MKISSAQTFSYKGPATRVKEGAPAGSVTLTMSGKFVSSTKATGNASFSGAKVAGCPPKSFTATKQ